MTDIEMKPLGVRLPVTLIEQFSERAKSEGLTQTELLQKMMTPYLDESPTKAEEIGPQNPPEKFEQERAELSHATATIKEVSQDIEKLIKKVKDSESESGYKKSLKDVAEEAAAINTLLGGIKRLHEIIATTHKLILEAADSASEPFQKIILDQQEQAKKLAEIYKAADTQIKALSGVVSATLQKAEKISSTLDSQVTAAVRDSAVSIHRKTEEYLDRRNGFFNFIFIGTIVSLGVGIFSLFFSIFYVQKQTSSNIDMVQSYVTFHRSFESAVCDSKKGQSARLKSLYETVQCK